MKPMKVLTPLLAAAGGAAHAHDGHGMPSIFHVHANDALLWLGVVALVLAVVLARRRK